MHNKAENTFLRRTRIASLITALMTLYVFGYYFRPTALTYTPFASVLPYWGYSVVFILCLFAIVKRHRPSSVTMAVFGYYAIYVFCTALNGGDFVSVAMDGLKVSLIVYYAQYIIEVRTQRLFCVVLPLLAVLVLVDLATIVLFPGGLFQQTAYQNEYFSSVMPGWLLGIKNNRILWLFSLVILSCIAALRNSQGKKALDSRTLFLGFVSVMCVVLVQSSTSTVVLVVFLAALFFAPALKHFSGMVNSATAVAVSAGTWFVVVILSNTDFLGPFLQTAFGKDTTFSGRSEIWTQAQQFILQSPVFGYGFESTVDKVIKYGNVSFVNAHNQLLEVSYDGGILLLTVFLAILGLVAVSLYRNRGSVAGVVGSLAFFLLGIEMLQEVLIENPIFWFIILLLYYMPHLGVEPFPSREDYDGK